MHRGEVSSTHGTDGIQGILHTDGYKLSMAEAGYPLRRETFYYTHRRGGPQLWLIDTEREVRALLPTLADGDLADLARAGYPMGEGFRAAIAGTVTITSLPKGAWFLPGEPVFSITGPSALVSWLEPQLLMWSFRAQVATLALTDRAALAAAVAVVSCTPEADIVREVLDSIHEPAPKMDIRADEVRAGAKARAAALVLAVGDPDRIFEVGLRAATSLEHHRLALEGCFEAGIRRTSHVALAKELGMIAVGTMGHEHVQRFGADEAAFRAMKDRRPQRSSFLLDTFDTLRSGLPSALRVMAETPDAGDSIRYDSGDKELQLRTAHARAKAEEIDLVHILEDGFDLPLTERFERIRKELGIPPDKLYYGYGGHLVGRGTLTRDRVAAVYKLSQSGTMAVMKFSDDAGKKNIPGEPVVFRRRRGEGPVGIIGQRGETVPEGYEVLSGASNDRSERPTTERIELSPATEALAATCEARRQSNLEPESRREQEVS
ncbi:nicotinate phosphoribosyltransferase [soil metagenome]